MESFNFKGFVCTTRPEYFVNLLCTHFAKKVDSEYIAPIGTVDFKFARCTLKVESGKFSMDGNSNSEEGFKRVKFVLTDHIERFGIKDKLSVVWL